MSSKTINDSNPSTIDYCAPACDPPQNSNDALTSPTAGIIPRICSRHRRSSVKGHTVGRAASDPLWPYVKHVVDSLLRTLRSSWNFITFLKRYLYASALSFSQTAVTTWTMLLFASLNGSVSITPFQAPFSISTPTRAQVNQESPTIIEQKSLRLKRKFGKGTAVGLCLVATGVLIQKWVDATNVTYNSPE